MGGGGGSEEGGRVGVDVRWEERHGERKCGGRVGGCRCEMGRETWGGDVRREGGWV